VGTLIPNETLLMLQVFQERFHMLICMKRFTDQQRTLADLRLIAIRCILSYRHLHYNALMFDSKTFGDFMITVDISFKKIITIITVK